MRHSTIVGFLAITAGLVLTSCSSTDASASEDTTVEVITPVGATIDMPEDPQEALGFYTTDVDILTTLGIPLSQTQPIRDEYTAFPDFFDQSKLEGLDTFHNYPEFNFEGVANANPDFILNGLGYEEDLDPKLQDIAPTYTYNAFDGADWRDSVSQAATDLGREEQWQAWEDEYQARVDEIRARLDEEGINPVVASISFWNDKVNIGCNGVPCLVFADLGLTIAPQANATESGLQDGEAQELSVEELNSLEGIDVVFDSADEDGVLSLDEEQLIRNPLWQNLPFVKNDQIYPYNMEMQFGSPSGQMAFLEVVEKALLNGN